MTTDWCQSSSPPFMGLTSCGICSSSSIIDRGRFKPLGLRVDAINLKDNNAQEKEETDGGLQTRTAGPIMRTTEGRQSGVMFVEELDEEDGWGRDGDEESDVFDDCTDFCNTPHSRADSYMDCNVELGGEVSCRPLSSSEPVQPSTSRPPAAQQPTEDASNVEPEESNVGALQADPTIGSVVPASDVTDALRSSCSFDHVDSSPADTEVVFASEHVSVCPSRDIKIAGRLSLVKQRMVLFMAWLPYSKGTLNEDGTFQLQDTRDSTSGERDSTMYAVHPIPLSDIKAIVRHVPRLSWHYIVIILNTGLTLPPFYFNKGGVRSFISALKENADPFMLKSALDPNTFLINDTPDPLQRSLHSLDLEDVLMGGPPVHSSATFYPQDGLAGVGKTNPISAGFSNITRIAKDKTSSFFAPGEGQGCEGGPRDIAASTPALPASQSEPGHKANSGNAWKGYPLIRRRSSSVGAGDAPSAADTEVGMFEFVDMKLQENRSTKGRTWDLPITRERWGSFFDGDGKGRLIHMDKFREQVFYSGVDPELRKEAWKFLLGFYPANSTQEDRLIMTVDKVQEYKQIRAQWESISAEQEKKFAKWRERKKRVEKDVCRTDRSHPYFDQDDGEPLNALHRILLTYTMYNFDLGYCQGMSDLLSPILYVIMKDVNPEHQGKWAEAEAETFWCFAALMEKMECNFHTDQRGMHAQLLALEKMLRLLDPQLYECFERHDCLNFFFCFRWVLILFKREFTFDEVLRLWEALWTRHKTDYFHLYMCIAVLIDHRKEIIGGSFDFDTLLRFCIDLSRKIPLGQTMRLAEMLSVHGKPYEEDCMGGLERVESDDD
ncbi:hypothetical protein BSKO_13276 [Bryopsis sp. KO-2023]|nr:hypothetical protein BSKO_13276 [Bryopsis sp. KO-2023]